eukprot:1145112-Pelagomonas_calceolata.AAC.17
MRCRFSSTQNLWEHRNTRHAVQAVAADRCERVAAPGLTGSARNEVAVWQRTHTHTHMRT